MNTSATSIKRSAFLPTRPRKTAGEKLALGRKTLLGLTVGILLSNSAPGADTITLNFDTLPANTFVGAQYSGVAGIRFDRKDLQNNSIDGGSQAYVQRSLYAYSPPNYLNIESFSAEFSRDYVRGVFASPTHQFVSAYVGVVNYASPPAVVTLTAYDAGNNVVGAASAALSTQIPGQWTLLTVTSPGASGNIAKFTIDGGSGNGVVIDDISFDSIASPFATLNPPSIQALLDQSGLPAPNGNYGFKFSLFNQSTAAIPFTHPITDSVSVITGLLSAPLSFSQEAFWEQPLFLGISVQGPSDAAFTQLGSPLPIAPAPQALYAYSAGSVLALDQGQAVTSLNGLTDGVQLQAGSGISITATNNTITISDIGTVAAPPGAALTAKVAAPPDLVQTQLTTLKNQNALLEKRISQLEQALQSLAGKN